MGRTRGLQPYGSLPLPAGQGSWENTLRLKLSNEWGQADRRCCDEIMGE